MAKYQILHGDCRKVLTELSRKFTLCFSDPPFGIGQTYQGFVDQFNDYEQFTREWLIKVWKSTHGVLCLHGPDHAATTYVDLEKELGLRKHRIAWVNWHYRFGQCRRSNWIDARCHCLIYAKAKPHTWNPELVLVESDRVKYKDKRVRQTERGGKRLPGTIWGVPSDGEGWGRVQGTSKQRWKNHPNQLPLAYLRRLILAYTNEGDWVLDPFCGSGTTLVAALELNRNCVGIDVSEANVESACQRILYSIGELQ